MFFELTNGREDEVRLGVLLLEVGGERKSGDIVVGHGWFPSGKSSSPSESESGAKSQKTGKKRG